MKEIIDFKEEFKDYENWYPNIPPKEIRKLKGRQIIFVTKVCRYRGYYNIESGIIFDAHRSFIIIDEGHNNIDKRDIIQAGIKKL